VPKGGAQRTTAKTVGAIGIVGFILAYLLLHLFPKPGAIVVDRAVTNVFGHAAGFIRGVILSIGIWISE